MSDRNLPDVSDVSLRGTYLALLLLLLACFVIHFVVSPSDWLSAFSLDVAAEIIGILLVIFSVDRVIDAEQERQRRKLEKVALRQLHKPLRRHLALLIRLGGDPPEAESSPITLETLFDEAYLVRVEALDLRQPVPDAEQGATWSKYILRECAQFREALNQTVEKYSLFVAPELVNKIEFVASSGFLWDTLQLLYAAMPALMVSDASLANRMPYATYRPDLEDAEYTLKRMKSSLAEHIEVMLDLVAEYNQWAIASLEITYSSDLQTALQRHRQPRYHHPQN